MRHHQVETPEHVAIGYVLADLGSRFSALLVDGLLITGLVLFVWVGPLLGAAWLFGAVGALGALSGWIVGVIVLVSFTIVWGYFIYFEGLRDGQTPGKRLMGIRVVHDGGFPVTLRGAAIRNLVRLAVDLQPMPSCVVGGLCMMLHPSTKRLGDLAAGTVVVRERTIARLTEEAKSAGAARGAPRLSVEAFAALAGYAARRGDLSDEVRLRVAGRLADRLQAEAPWPTDRTADDYLVELYEDETGRRTAAGASAAAGTPAAAALVRQKRPAWAAYQRLVDRARRGGLKRLPEDEVSRFAHLYRETTADLARARTYGASSDLVYTLERMVGAGHNLLYRPPHYAMRDAAAWIASGFPALVRRHWRPIALASLLLYLPAVLAYAAIRSDPPRARALLPAEMIVRAEVARDREADGVGYVEVPEVVMPVMATSIIANNVQVTFMAFAGGVLGGLGTAAILVVNGVFLGAVVALFENHGASLHLWTFVLPHGIIELTAITIAGGAGLWMGSALALPGRRTRGEALARRGRDAIGLLAGTTLLLVVAGLIEGFISPAAIPREAKLGAATLFALLLVAYLFGAGRRPAGSATA